MRGCSGGSRSCGVSEHSCAEWVSLRISCPEGLLSAQIPSGGGGNAPKPVDVPTPEDEVHDRTTEPTLVPSDGFELERLVLLELNKRVSRRQATPREATVEKLAARARSTGAARSPVVVPAELVREAVRQGARNPELGLWVAAASLLLAAGLQRAAVIGVVRGVISAVRGARAGTGGVGFRVNAAAQLEKLMQVGTRRLIDSERTGAGSFFPGTEG